MKRNFYYAFEFRIIIKNNLVCQIIFKVILWLKGDGFLNFTVKTSKRIDHQEDARKLNINVYRPLKCGQNGH